MGRKEAQKGRKKEACVWGRWRRPARRRGAVRADRRISHPSVRWDWTEGETRGGGPLAAVIAARAATRAGELGQTQFLPTHYFNYAVDYDGDGHRNLLRSAPDVIALDTTAWSTQEWMRWIEGLPTAVDLKHLGFVCHAARLGLLRGTATSTDCRLLDTQTGVYLVAAPAKGDA